MAGVGVAAEDLAASVEGRSVVVVQGVVGDDPVRIVSLDPLVL